MDIRYVIGYMMVGAVIALCVWGIFQLIVDPLNFLAS